jgi:aminoglycoside phosphotransferase (APT) family kinase protein
MPVPDQRDPSLTCSLLQGWLGERLSRADGVAVTDLRTPGASGFSSETLLFDAAWTEGGEPRRQALVARVGPTAYRLFPEPRFEEQCRLLQVLDRATDLPVPPVRFYEPDSGLLGAPFVVMDRVAGRVPADLPTYHQEGWVADASPGDRERMWWGTLELLARVHALDPAALGLDFVDRPEHGRRGIDQQLGYWEHYLEWADVGELPVARRALAWLRAEQPPDPPGPARLLWGDARIGNVIFEDYTPRAVLDWEMAALGPPAIDLAWFLYLDRHHSEGYGLARLDGFPSRERTVERYQELTGREVRDLDYLEMLAAVRFGLIMARLGRLFVEFGMVPAEIDFTNTNTAMRLLAVILEARC